MKWLGPKAAVAASVIALLGIGAAEVSAEPVRWSVSRTAAPYGASPQDVARLPRAALLHAALVMNEGDTSTKRDQLARILQRQ